MEKEALSIQISKVTKKFLEKIDKKEIMVVSHFDTDGISSASIMIKTLKRLDKKFTLRIVKSLNEGIINSLPKDKIILFLDLASSSFDQIVNANLIDVFILDHHEITQSVPYGIEIVNPQLNGKEKISGAGITYLFCKEIDEKNTDLAKLAVLGMIGDRMEKEIEKLNHGIVNDGDIKKKRGPLIYPSTRPLNRTLEYCSNPYIPDVTGNVKGVLELLRESGISPVNGKYPSLIELSNDETEKLTTSMILRIPKINQENLIGDIFLIKLFNKLEDARELSAMINACSRLGSPQVAIQVCMEISKAKKEAESIHVKYRQHIISGLTYARETENKFEGKGFVLINGKDKIKDTMAGTIASILSSSNVYEEGTILITMAYNEDTIKVSARMCGDKGRNVREVLKKIVDEIGGEVGGHEFAAGCNISIEHEEEFIKKVQKNFELEVIKI